MNKTETAIQYMQVKDYEKAAQVFGEIIQEHPDDPVGYINFGNLLTHIKEYQRAGQFFEEAIRLDPQAGAAYYGFGTILFEQEQYAEARKQFQQALSCGLEEGDVHYSLGMTFYKENQSRLAIPYLMRASELLPDDMDVAFQYALALAQNQFIEEAKEVFERVLSFDEAHSDAHYNLGVIAMYHDQVKAAYNHFQAALTSQPDHALASNGLKQAKLHLRHDNEQ
ncbi:putative UDP-N-acetylglucosamine--peptide N-acetylglucosaminyltransferase SEC [Lentibacillus sp. JNUCC-1]|uniref:tetratricopeptide repeat protein n=1 Tax=Lentibacillus sp. JNUCC-1 TaxID=2654513 RepID=UPI0012E87673|nr:tetratricopeptide repeat protein [Lentibacillus sp. JNUCC-1]MUV39540.1 putative UDP-N-acetylglucosamine--peptide N-acetylglucosaminyltransferase SEC [Lentibacillus sp. JNUCC-1]